MTAPRLVVIGASAGGIEVLRAVFADLPARCHREVLRFRCRVGDARAATIRGSLLREGIPPDDAPRRAEDDRGEG